MADSSRTLLVRRGALVVSRCKALGWTQVELARRARRDQTTVSAVERGGHDVSLNLAARLAPPLDLTVEKLLVAEVQEAVSQ